MHLSWGALDIAGNVLEFALQATCETIFDEHLG
jgi:hypothetical protein